MSNKIFFTSDTHFYHNNIIKLCNRPFTDMHEMNEKLIENWNSVVPKDGIVYHLGDFCLCKSVTHHKEILSRLNGKIHLILGNHDKINNEIKPYFESISYQEVLHIDDKTIYLNHFPFLCFPGGYKDNVWQLFGHVHSKPGNRNADTARLLDSQLPTQYDVGVDNNNYTPVSWEEVKEIINNQGNLSSTI